MCFGWRHRPSCASPRVQVSALSSAVPDGKKKELLRIDKFIKAIDGFGGVFAFLFKVQAPGFIDVLREIL